MNAEKQLIVKTHHLFVSLILCMFVSIFYSCGNSSLVDNKAYYMENNKIYLYDFKTNKSVIPLPFSEKEIFSFELSPKQDFMVYYEKKGTLSADHEVFLSLGIYDVKKGEIVTTMGVESNISICNYQWISDTQLYYLEQEYKESENRFCTFTACTYTVNGEIEKETITEEQIGDPPTPDGIPSLDGKLYISMGPGELDVQDYETGEHKKYIRVENYNDEHYMPIAFLDANRLLFSIDQKYFYLYNMKTEQFDFVVERPYYYNMTVISK